MLCFVVFEGDAPQNLQCLNRKDKTNTGFEENFSFFLMFLSAIKGGTTRGIEEGISSWNNAAYS